MREYHLYMWQHQLSPTLNALFTGEFIRIMQQNLDVWAYADNQDQDRRYDPWELTS